MKREFYKSVNTESETSAANQVKLLQLLLIGLLYVALLLLVSRRWWQYLWWRLITHFETPRNIEVSVKVHDSDFTDVIKLLGPDDLENLYYELGLSTQDIQKAKTNAGTNNVELRARAVLELWRNQNGQTATHTAITSALERCRQREFKETLEDKWKCKGSFKYDIKQLETELKYHYIQTRSKIPFRCDIPKQLTAMENIFVDLELLEEECRTSDPQPKTRKLNCSKLVKLVNTRDIRVQRILVRGNPGMGKTILISKLAYDWAVTKSKSDYDLVFAIDICKVRSVASLVEIVHEQLLKWVPVQALKECISPALRILWLFDGYDEAPADVLASDITDVWSSPGPSNHCVVVTTRPNKVTNFIHAFGPYTHVQLTGFSERNTVKYVCKYFELNLIYQWALTWLYRVILTDIGNLFVSWFCTLKSECTISIDLLRHLKGSFRIKQLSKYPIFFINDMSCLAG